MQAPFTLLSSSHSHLQVSGWKFAESVGRQKIGQGAARRGLAFAAPWNARPQNVREAALLHEKKTTCS